MLKRKETRGDSKQRNTTRHRGAYISKGKSGDGIANMSAFHYSNRQQLIINRQLKTNHQYFLGGFTRSFFVIVVVEVCSISFVRLCMKKVLIITFHQAINLIHFEHKRFKLINIVEVVTPPFISQVNVKLIYKIAVHFISTVQ